MILPLLFIVLALKHACADSFQPVTETCKYWKPVSIFRNGEKSMLHCILDENDQLGIVNTTWTLMTKGRCPYFNRHTEQIGSFTCKESDGKCPEKVILSYEATQFSGCLKETRQSKNFSKTSTDVAQQASGPLAIAVLLLVILCISGVIVAFWVFRRQELRIKKLREKIQQSKNCTKIPTDGDCSCPDQVVSGSLEEENAELSNQIQSAKTKENGVETQATENGTIGETTRLFVSNE